MTSVLIDSWKISIHNYINMIEIPTHKEVTQVKNDLQKRYVWHYVRHYAQGPQLLITL